MTLLCHPFDIQYLICFLICSLFWYYCFFFKFWITSDPNISFSQLPLRFWQAHLCIHSVMESSLRRAAHLCDSRFACVPSLTITQDTQQRRRPNRHKAVSCAPVLTSEQCLVWAHNQLAKLHLFVPLSNLNLTITQPNHHHNPDLTSKGTGIGRDRGNGLRLQVARERARTWIRRWTPVS